MPQNKEDNLREYLETINCFLVKIKSLNTELDQVKPPSQNYLVKYCDISQKIYDLYYSILGCEFYYYPITTRIGCIYDLIGEYTKLRAKSITLYQRWKGTVFNINYIIPPSFSNRGSWNMWKKSKLVLAVPVPFNQIPPEDRELIKNLSNLEGDEDYIITYLSEILRIYIRYLASVLTGKIIFPVFCESGQTGECSVFCQEFEEIFRLLSEYILSTPIDEVLSKYLYDQKIICSMLSINDYYYQKLRYQLSGNRVFQVDWALDRQFCHLNFGEALITVYFRKLPKELYESLC